MRPAGRQRGVRGRRARVSRRSLSQRFVLIAVIGDTHLPRGARRLPDECVARLRTADLILHTGDFTASSVLEELEELAPVAAVRGNMDDAALQARLPDRLVVAAEGLRIGLVHDAGVARGRHERLRSWFPDCEVVVYGHSHMPELERSGEVWVINPGSPTERRRSTAHTMVVFRSGRPRLVVLG